MLTKSLSYPFTSQRNKKFFTVTIISFLFLSLGNYLVPSSGLIIEEKFQQYTTKFDGQILFAPMDSKITYLIDNTGAVNHTWSSSYLPGVGVRWLGDGMILRTIRVGIGPGTGGAGGGVQKVAWDGTVVWDFRYNTNGCCSHHDVRVLPNGNVLLIAWETKTRAEAIAVGRNPNFLSNGLYPDHIIEVQPTGSLTGTIVWEWHVWDHLIQDYDISKANYGVVKDHPELVDINYAASSEMDWMHTNSIDYNEEFDQILINVCYFDEIWIIDHSTTTPEAASHSGGKSGKGGDLLYRWGNPAAYQSGTKSDQKLFNQHDASWIKEGCPGEGHILVFNNGMGRSGSRYSSIDEIIPPINEKGEYYLSSGSAYGPDSQTWIYTATPPTSFYSYHLSGAERLADGSTLICSGEPGIFFQVTLTGETEWTYRNPYPAGAANNVFKIVYISKETEQPELNTSDLDCIGSLSWTDVKPGQIVNGSFQIRNVGNSTSFLNWIIDTSSITWGTWFYAPENGENLSPHDGEVTVYVSVVAPDQKNSDFAGYIRVENLDNPDDIEWIPISLSTPVRMKSDQRTMVYQFLFYLLQKYLDFEKL